MEGKVQRRLVCAGTYERLPALDSHPQFHSHPQFWTVKKIEDGGQVEDGGQIEGTTEMSLLCFAWQPKSPWQAGWYMALPTLPPPPQRCLFCNHGTAATAAAELHLPNR